jgi:hypothetical protein
MARRVDGRIQTQIRKMKRWWSRINHKLEVMTRGDKNTEQKGVNKR